MRRCESHVHERAWFGGLGIIRPQATADHGPDPSGKIPFVNEFKYLGSYINSWLDDVSDVRNRIKSAAGIFAKLQCVFQLNLLPQTKARLYSTCVLSALLYG